MKALARTAPCFLALLTSFGCTDESNVRYVPSNVADSVKVTYYENFVEVELESDGAATLDTLVQITGVLVYQGDVYLLADNGVTTAFFTPNGGLEGRMASSVVFAKEDTILFAGQQKIGRAHV